MSPLRSHLNNSKRGAADLRRGALIGCEVTHVHALVSNGALRNIVGSRIDIPTRAETYLNTGKDPNLLIFSAVIYRI